MKLWFLAIFLFNSCSFFWGKPNTPLSAKGSLYTIKFNRHGWILRDDVRSDYIFEKSENGQILLSNSFCNEFQEQPLDQIALKAFIGVKDLRIKNQGYLNFNQREAYEIKGSGFVDGVEVNIQLLNTRRNNCYFDFMDISPQKSKNQEPVFEHFLKSVVFK